MRIHSLNKDAKSSCRHILPFGVTALSAEFLDAWKEDQLPSGPPLGAALDPDESPLRKDEQRTDGPFRPYSA